MIPFYDPYEPANSWEVSWMLAYHKYPTGIPEYKLKKKIQHSRLEELKEWSREYFDQRWANNHS